MFRWCVSLGALLALFLGTSRATAQDGGAAALFPTPILADGPALSHEAPCREHLLAMQLLLGLEDGVRLQVEAYHGERWTFMAEATVGAGLLVVPNVSAGVRAAWRAAEGDKDAFLIAPGLSGVVVPSARHGAFDHDNYTALSASVDFSWVHDFQPHLASELGVELGLLVPLRAADLYIPNLTIFTGLRF